MSIHRVGPDDVEGFTLQVNPARTFFSSSTEGVTGTVGLFPRSSPNEKEVQPLSMFMDSVFRDSDLQVLLDAAREATGSNIRNPIEAYMSGVNSQARSVRKQQTLEIVRFEPSVTFSRDTQRKNVIRNVLYPYHRHVYPAANWAYTNYHTLNFFTASSVPASSVLLYPNSASAAHGSAASGSYTLRDEFTVTFYINPRYTTDGPFDDFRAGTIMHLTSSYAVSLVTGSSRDETGKPDGFRILLQVLSGANVQPHLATTSTQLCYFSDDNSLRRNHWHRVAIRWSASVNDHTGSFLIDSFNAGVFVIPSASIAPPVATGFGNPDVLCVGNFYTGPNSGSSVQSLFFNQNVANREGLVPLIDDGVATTDTPVSWSFAHPLNAEVHELTIYDRFLSEADVSSSMTEGPVGTGSMKFYVPPFFTRESPTRRPYGTNALSQPIGGVMQTPFFSISGTTVDPFNVGLSFGVGGRMMNLENFTRDLVTRNYPRLFHLTASDIGVTVSSALTANSLLYDEQTNFFTGSVRRRNVTVLPCDNGRFRPNFGLIASTSLDMRPASGSLHDRYTNDLGNLDLSLISIAEMFPTSALYSGLGNLQSGSVFEGIVGATPEAVGVDPGEVYTIFQRTRDPSSNEITFFDISNIFYGRRIFPTSLYLTDPAVTGTRGKVSVTLRDNGIGGLYRADASTPHATWNNVGDVFYDEGIVVVKNPCIPFFGKDAFRVELRGEQNIHILRLNVLARAGEVNSSSNPAFEPLSASLLAHETDARFVYITGLNFHDDNLNVIMKTRLAQPIIKRHGDRYLFRVKMDF